MATQFELPKLPYKYTALEPVISSKTLKVHHDKHHQTYTDNFNKALEAEGVHETNIIEIFKRISTYPMAMRNHGGGYYNHIFYFESLGKSEGPTGELLDAINHSFGSLDNFKEEFSNHAKTLFGSGWTWLGKNDNGTLTIYNTINQDNCFMDVVNENSTPLLVIDVWDHAYYLDYQNRRPEHIEKFFDIINWNKVAERFNEN